MFKRTVTCLVWFMVLSAQAPSAEELRDPTRPKQPPEPREQPAPATQYSLDSILVSDSRRIAVINGVSVATGGSVAGATVKRIARDRVLLDINGKSRTLVLDTAPSIRQQ